VNQRTLGPCGAHCNRLCSGRLPVPDSEIVFNEAMNLNSTRAPSKPKKKNLGSKHGLAVPGDLSVALKADKKAAATFATFSHSHKREYIKWVTEAKRPETREKRIAEMLNRLKPGTQKS
jgi:Bacteriocin-protection, YdeI or OmpD-Associated